ncbi:hypothetical protein GQ600_15193 [Phytophthora cactorum]|nr:hypothetical protein GQ600_15193 [Phytophthora cactorum]
MGIETWNYNNFLQRFEGVRSDRRLTRMGGQPGQNLAGAKTYAGSTIDNRNELFSLNRAAYDRKMKNTLKPFRLDDGGFTGISSMLELTDALDVRNPKTEHQLSLRALPECYMISLSTGRPNLT